MNAVDQSLMKKLQSLPPEQVAVVEDFVDFLQHRESERGLVEAASRLAEPSFQTLWDNPHDADYDRL